MTPRCHPDEALLQDYASGALPTAAGLTVSAHLDFCPACRRLVSQFEEAGGEMLHGLSGSPLSPGALGATMSKLDKPEGLERRHTPSYFLGSELPLALKAIGIGRRRWLGRGAWVAHTNASTAHGWRCFLLSLPPGGRLPAHSHGGPELTVVLQGTFHDGQDQRRPGDFIAADRSVEHQIVVGPEGRCACLISVQGPIRWRNPWVAATRPLTGI